MVRWQRLLQRQHERSFCGDVYWLIPKCTFLQGHNKHHDQPYGQRRLRFLPAYTLDKALDTDEYTCMLLSCSLALSSQVVCGQVSSSDRVTSSTSVETCSARPHTSNRHNPIVVQGHRPSNTCRHLRMRQAHGASCSSAAHKHQARANAVVNTLLTNWCCLQLQSILAPSMFSNCC